MQKVFNVAVDIGRKLPAPAFEVNTNDLKSVKLIITITNGQTLLNLTDTTVRIAIRKPDSHIIFQDCTVKDATGGQVEIILENQAYITPGTHTAEIMCYKGSEVVAVSGTFSYKSTKGIMNDEAVESKSEFTVINQKIEEARKLLEDAAESGVGVDEQARQEIQQVTTKLAEKVSKVNGKVPDSSGNVTIEVPQVDTSKLATKQELQNIGSATPKGVYAALTDLQAAFPTGTTGIYVVQSDGKWYYWNGTAWTAGGQYQSTGIAEKSITANMLNFVTKTGGNLYNQDTETPGHNISPTGVFTAIATYNVSDFIQVEPGGTYSFYAFLHMATYDSNKNFIERIDLTANGTTKTLGTNVQFIRLNVQNFINAFPQRRMNKGATLLPYEVSAISIPGLKLETESVNSGLIKEKEIGLEKVSFANRTSTNLFNENAVYEKKTVSETDGSLVDHSTNITSHLIPVKPATSYTFVGISIVSYYDINKKFIQRATVSSTAPTVTTPSNARYARLTFPNFNPWNDGIRQMNEGTTKLPYEPFYSTFEMGSGFEKLNDIIKNDKLDRKDSLMIDVPIDGVFTSKETFRDYPELTPSKFGYMYDLMDALKNDFPDYITKREIGKDALNNPIFLYNFKPKLPKADKTTKQIKIMLTAGTHGWEKAGSLSSYLMFKEMCYNWKKYPLLEALRFNVEWLFVPVVNPSGWDLGTRPNANGVDINRNMPHQWMKSDEGKPTFSGNAPLSEPEAQAIYNLIEQNPDVNIFNDFHNFSFTEENKNNFIWVLTDSDSYIQHMGQNLVTRMSRKWWSEYGFIPEGTLIGYTGKENGGSGQIQNYARTKYKFAATLEICNVWGLDPNRVPHNKDVAKAGMEAVTNWFLINLKELIK